MRHRRGADMTDCRVPWSLMCFLYGLILIVNTSGATASTRTDIISTEALLSTSSPAMGQTGSTPFSELTDSTVPTSSAEANMQNNSSQTHHLGLSSTSPSFDNSTDNDVNSTQLYYPTTTIMTSSTNLTETDTMSSESSNSSEMTMASGSAPVTPTPTSLNNVSSSSADASSNSSVMTTSQVTASSTSTVPNNVSSSSVSSNSISTVPSTEASLRTTLNNVSSSSIGSGSSVKTTSSVAVSTPSSTKIPVQDGITTARLMCPAHVTGFNQTFFQIVMADTATKYCNDLKQVNCEFRQKYVNVTSVETIGGQVHVQFYFSDGSNSAIVRREDVEKMLRKRNSDIDPRSQCTVIPLPIEKQPSTLPGWAVALIVILSIFVVVAVIITLFNMKKKRNRNRESIYSLQYGIGTGEDPYVLTNSVYVSESIVEPPVSVTSIENKTYDGPPITSNGQGEATETSDTKDPEQVADEHDIEKEENEDNKS